jgi:pimeloyl-ACP methyl ester carboxylesterase
MHRLVEALAETLDVLVGRSTPVDLCGFSFGGLAAARVAAKRGHVRRLALIGAGGHGGPRRQTIELVDWRLPDRADRLAALARNLVPFMLNDARRSDALALAVHERSCLQTRFRSKEIARAGGLPEALDRVDAPVLLLWGEHDVTAVPTEVGTRLAAGRADRRFDVVPDTGHWAQYESPDVVNALLREWFGP